MLQFALDTIFCMAGVSDCTTAVLIMYMCMRVWACLCLSINTTYWPSQITCTIQHTYLTVSHDATTTVVHMPKLSEKTTENENVCAKVKKKHVASVSKQFANNLSFTTHILAHIRTQTHARRVEQAIKWTCVMDASSAARRLCAQTGYRQNAACNYYGMLLLLRC